MSSSPSRLHQDEEAVATGNQKPEWLDAFLARTFFDCCLAHPIRKNELNKYCINCNMTACQYCMASGAHRSHKVLKIYRHVYRDVVSLAAMEKHVDCSQIQPYRCNKRLVVSLTPLPHSGPAANIGASCESCQRKLFEPDLYRYCCIACKVLAFSRKASDSDPPFLSIHTSNKEKQKKDVLKPRKCLRKRKGKPFRAPFF